MVTNWARLWRRDRQYDKDTARFGHLTDDRAQWAGNPYADTVQRLSPALYLVLHAGITERQGRNRRFPAEMYSLQRVFGGVPIQRRPLE